MKEKKPIERTTNDTIPITARNSGKVIEVNQLDDLICGEIEPGASVLRLSTSWDLS